jgi:histone H3/H4
MNILTSKTIDKGNSPKDITIIRKMFDSLGIEEYEKNTLNYMSEFINSYIIDILKESKKNMILSNREKINIEDVELAVQKKQNLMYENRPTVSRMKRLAEKVNSIPLPLIPESPNVLMPPIENNLLRNNFQIYSDELNRALLDEENKNVIESSSLRPDDINMLGNKRKINNIGTDSKNTLNYDNKMYGGIKKKHRKISLNQAFKKSSQENAKKENENNNNIKINFNESKTNELDLDMDNDENENNNNVDSTNNLKDEDDDDLKIGEEDEVGDDNEDDVEGEEMEGDNDNENDNESNNGGNESFSEKDEEKNNNKKSDENKFGGIHDDENDEDNFDI